MEYIIPVELQYMPHSWHRLIGVINHEFCLCGKATPLI